MRCPSAASSSGATPESIGVWLPGAAHRVSGDLYLRLSEDDDEVDRRTLGAFQFPCFEKATSISLVMCFHGLAVPPAGVFARLTDLHLRRVRFHGPGDLGDAVSSPRCPCLKRLTIDDAHGLCDLAIHSESLLLMELRSLRGLSQLTLVSPVLTELTVRKCLRSSRRVANISAPQLEKLDWSDEYDPSSVHLGRMEHLQWLRPSSCVVYGNPAPAFLQLHNRSCLSFLRRFERIKTLFLMLVYPQDIKNYQYMMEDMRVLPNITFLCLTVRANGHAFEASAFHVLRLCTGIRRLILHLHAPVSEAPTVCSSDCICDQPADWKNEELLLNHLEKVEISGWSVTEHEVAFVKRLFEWGTKLKEMTVTFRYSTSEMKAKESYKIFQSFSTPGVCMKFYLDQKYSKVLYAPKE